MYKNVTPHSNYSETTTDLKIWGSLVSWNDLSQYNCFWKSFSWFEDQIRKVAQIWDHAYIIRHNHTEIFFVVTLEQC